MATDFKKIEMHILAASWKNPWFHMVGIKTTSSSSSSAAGGDTMLNTSLSRKIAKEDARRAVVKEKARDNKYRTLIYAEREAFKLPMKMPEGIPAGEWVSLGFATLAPGEKVPYVIKDYGKSAGGVCRFGNFPPNKMGAIPWRDFCAEWQRSHRRKDFLSILRSCQESVGWWIGEVPLRGICGS